MAITIVAKGIIGREYKYNPYSAHKVSDAGAPHILHVLNELRYHLKDNETWHIYVISEKDQIAFKCASEQSFKRRNGSVYEESKY